MPPAETTTRRPARSRGSASGRSSSSRASSAISAGSGSRPGPVSRPVSRPEAGSMTTDAAVAQQRHVVPRGRVLPHLGVHRGREQHRAAGREQRGGQQVVGAAVRGAGQQVRRRRGDDHEVRLLAQLDVRDRRDVGEHPGVHGLPGQRLERGGADEPQRRRRGQHADRVPGLGQPPEQLARLVGGDPAGHPEQDPGRGVRVPGHRVPGHCVRIHKGCYSAPSVCSSSPAWISRIAIDSGFSRGPGSTSGPTYSSRPSPSCE